MVAEVISIEYQQNPVGALNFDKSLGYGVFEYHPKFIESGIELSPIHMPLSDKLYFFPFLNPATFKGLPGMIADSLPDDFGNRILNAWVLSQGRAPQSISPVERLHYTGSRGMGALEYTPAKRVKSLNASESVAINELVQITQAVLNDRNALDVSLTSSSMADPEAMLALLSVGTSAGGARAKAVLAFNEDFTQVRSGQTTVPANFNHYLMKFDGVNEHNKNSETFGDPMGFGAMEYVYYLMAKNCGINMMECKLLNEGHRRHFLTKRFDRNANQKIHIQSLNGLAHVDYKLPGSYSYEEIFLIARKLRLPPVDAMDLLRRMVFNIIARNHDDHSKNFAFMLDAESNWRLTPAYDLAYSYKPGSNWVDQHWMSLNGKRDDFNRSDFMNLVNISPLFNPTRIALVIEEVKQAVSQWRVLAQNEGVPEGLIQEVESNLRLNI